MNQVYNITQQAQNGGSGCEAGAGATRAIPSAKCNIDYLSKFRLRGRDNDYCRGPFGSTETAQHIGNGLSIQDCAKGAIDRGLTGFDYMSNGVCWGWNLPTVGSYEPTAGSSDNRGCWVKNDLQPGKIIGGRENDGKLLYSCNAYYNNGTHPGKTRDDWNSCNIGWGGQEYGLTSYNTLQSSHNYYWDRNIYNPVVGGNQHDGNLYVCRAYYNGGIHPGKTKNGWGACNIGWGGSEIGVSNFEYLNQK
jgi:hypothetical protein